MGHARLTTCVPAFSREAGADGPLALILPFETVPGPDARSQRSGPQGRLYNGSTVLGERWPTEENRRVGTI